MIDCCGRNIDYMRISLTELCNLRCIYCMPHEGIQKKEHKDMMSWEDFLRAAGVGASLGIKKIRITGGEPLVKRGIVELCRDLAATPGLEELCLTTNGTLLSYSKARALKAAGVDRFNISIDTLNASKYREITRTGNLQDALGGLYAADKAGFKRTKINVVLMKGFNDDEILQFVELTNEREWDVRFIELMPIGEGVQWSCGSYLPAEEVLFRVPELEATDKMDGVAQMYVLPGAKGRVGLIRPVSCAFCKDCNKIRLTADGKLKACIHREEEVSIKGMNQEKMKEIMAKVILSKPEGGAVLSPEKPSRAGRRMNCIGG